MLLNSDVSAIFTRRVGCCIRIIMKTLLTIILAIVCMITAFGFIFLRQEKVAVLWAGIAFLIGCLMGKALL